MQRRHFPFYYINSNREDADKIWVRDLYLNIAFYFFLHGQVEPNFYSKNHLLLGKIFLRQNKKEEAKMWLDKAVNSNPGKTVDDKSVSKAKQKIQCHRMIIIHYIGSTES